mmetsp:Transcript_26506/g.40231  ORF Transcript_26506/g.40231 Transcript_26506/m.40231 type:complete len:809 (+) Transcript_26506:83-2509(+)
MASNDGNLSFITAVCGCDEGRAMELLEAGGSVERAVEIHFSHSQDDNKNSQTARKPTAHASPRKRAKTENIENIKSVFELSNLHDKKLQASRNEDLQQEQEQKKLPDLSLNKTGLIENKITREDRLQYLRLAEAFTKMAETSKRLVKLDAMQNVLRDIIEAVGGIGGDEESRKEDAKVLQYAIELTVGSTLKLQVSGAAVSKAVITVTGASSSQLRSSYRKTGDLGDVAAMYIRNQRLLVKPKPLSIVTVFQTLESIASQTGKGSQNSRHILMVKLLRSCRSYEIRFLVRTLLGNMRLGANIRTVLAALALAVNKNSATNDSAIKSVQDTFDFCPRVDKTCLSLLVGGIQHMINTCTLEVGTCINPMLANPAHSLEEVQKMMKDGGPSIAEWKYDGVRCQAHFTGETVMLFSRHMLENTDQFPDAVEFLMEAKNSSVSSFIIDAEIVGIENETDGDARLLPFQDLSTRRGNKADEKNIQIKIFAFDLMFLNGRALVKHSLRKRRQLLLENFNITKGFAFAQSLSLTCFDQQIIKNFLQTAISGGAEGLMVKLMGEFEVDQKEESQKLKKGDEKKLSCRYESGVRSHTWLKVKKDYVAGYSDTIDCVPIGAWYGNGRKAQKGFLSPVLLAVYDEADDVFRSISRCMSFTDAMYTAMHDFYLKGIPYPKGLGLDDEGEIATADELESGDTDTNETQNSNSITETQDDEFEPVNCYSSRPSALIVTNESPPIWFKPSEVFEVSFADLTLSKQHSAAAGLVDSSTRGVALRFPRFKRRRPDKRIDQATTSAQIAELFAKQTKQKQGGNTLVE